MNEVKTFETGDRIYYTGDMANAGDFGVIIKVRPADPYMPLSYDIALDDGRILHGVWHMMFAEGRARRFWLRSDWEIDRKIKIEQLYASFRKQEVSNK